MLHFSEVTGKGSQKFDSTFQNRNDIYDDRHDCHHNNRFHFPITKFPNTFICILADSKLISKYFENYDFIKIKLLNSPSDYCVQALIAVSFYSYYFMMEATRIV